MTGRLGPHLGGRPAMPRTRLTPSQIAGSAAPLTCRPSGRTLAEFGELSAAEKTLVECCRRGKEALIAEARPKRRTKANQVRASLIRFLALGGDERAPVHEYGVALRGAWITDTLEIEDNTIPYSLSLID